MKLRKIKQIFQKVLFFTLFGLFVSVVVDLWRQPDVVNLASSEYRQLNGDWVSFSELSHQEPLLIYVWASWCPICKLTSANVQRLAEQNINLLSIALRSGNDDQVNDFMQKNGLQLKTINDPRGNITGAWGVKVTPTFLFVIDGRVVGSTVGLSSPWGLKLRLWWYRIYTAIKS